jgi:hypothetical protein
VSGIDVFANRYLAACGHSHDTVVVLDATDGREVTRLSGGQDPAWAPDRPRLAVPAPAAGRSPAEEILVHDLNGAQTRLAVREGTGSPAWSPDGQYLAAPTRDAVILWDARTLQRVRLLSAGHPARIRLDRVAWSPNGTMLAAAPTDRRSPVNVWDTTRWEVVSRLGPAAGSPLSRSLAWSPDSRLLAFPSPRDHASVEVWDAAESRRVLTISPADDRCRYAWVIRWAPDGGLGVSYGNGMVVRWTGVITPGADSRPLPLPIPLLAQLGSAAAGCAVAQPMAVLADLVSLLQGRSPDRLSAVVDHRRVAMLRALRWPPPAVLGLALLVAADLPPDERYRPPEQVGVEAVTAELVRALSGRPVPAVTDEAPIVDLTGALDRIDDETLAVARMLGPETVAARPELLVRIRRLHLGNWQLTPRQRRVLGVRAVLNAGTVMQGRGRGGSRAGISRHGELSALLHSQLVLDDDLLVAKQARDDLLYRTREGSLPPAAQPVVFVLDDTPPVHGLVGSTLRVVAQLLATHLIGKHRRCALIRMGPPARVRFLATPVDLVELWSPGSPDPPATDAAQRLVGSATAQLVDPLGGRVRVVVLTHPYLPWPDREGQHVIRVHYPGRPVEASAPRTHILPPDGDFQQIQNVIAAVLADRQ